MKRYAAKPTVSGAKAALIELAVEDTIGPQGYLGSNAVNTTRKMYRDPNTFRSPMFDRRIVRGSTIVRHVENMAGETRTARETLAKKKALAKQLEVEKKSREMMIRARLGCDPPMVYKRDAEPVDLRKHLEEIVDKEPEVESVETMVDMFLDRPETPPYVPAKTGMDASTQIEPEDLWDFDMEVWPILEVLVGKTTEQALIEVIEEEEILLVYEQQRKYIEMRLAEEAEKNRLIEQERRLRVEKERRIKEYHLAVALQRETEERIAAAVFAHGYIADLLPNVLEGLKMAGYLLEDIREFVEMDFMPGLMSCVDNRLDERVTVQDILTMIIREIQETKALVYKELGENQILPLPFIPREVQSYLDLELEDKPSETYITEIMNMGMEEDVKPPEPEPEAVTGKRLVLKPPVGGYIRRTTPETDMPPETPNRTPTNTENDPFLPDTSSLPEELDNPIE